MLRRQPKGSARVPPRGVMIWHKDKHSAEPVAEVRRALRIEHVRIEGLVGIDQYLAQLAGFIRGMRACLAKGQVKAGEGIVAGRQKRAEAVAGLADGRSPGKSMLRLVLGEKLA